MKAPKWWLRRRLKKAARLVRSGSINRWQYSAIAIKAGYDLMGRPLNVGDEVDHYTFGVRLAEHLGVEIANAGNLQVVVSMDERYKRAVETYGPYNEATVTLEFEKGQTLVWNGDQANREKSAALLLSRVNHAAFRLQDWWNEQERIFALFTKLTPFIAGVIVGVVFSRIAAEFILIVFRINEHLGAIRDQGQMH